MGSKTHAIDLTGTGYCASLNFRRTARAVTSLFDDALAASGIRSTQFTILVGIAKIQPASMSAVAKVLVIDRTTLTRSLRLLQKEGFLTISERGEMRQRFVSLTPKGEEAMARALPLWRRIQKHFIDAIGSDYWLNLRNDLERLSTVATEMENKAGHEQTAVL
jgi:DNA-binding MarR family transcriptional regulator